MKLNLKRSVGKIGVGSSSCSMPGVWRAVAYCQGILVIFHSPRACTHIAGVMNTSSYFRAVAKGDSERFCESVPILSSMLNEKHAVFGGEARLTQCIEHAVQHYHPACILIANSCVSGIIGDDISAIAQQAEKQWQLPIIAIHCAGFLDGEYLQGYYETAVALIERFMQPLPVQENTVFLLGDYGGMKSAYFRELKKILQKFGLSLKGQFPTYIKFEDLPQLAASSLNIVLGGRRYAEHNIEKLAQLLHAKFQTPYYAQDYPLGWTNTQRWLRGLGQLLNKQAIAEQIIAKYAAHRQQMLDKIKANVQGRRVVLFIGRRLDYFQPQWIFEVLQALDLAVAGIVLSTDYLDTDCQQMQQHLATLTAAPLYSYEQAGQIIADSALVLTTHELELTQIRQIFLPMIPALGIAGEVALAGVIDTAINRCGKNGGILYGY